MRNNYTVRQGNKAIKRGQSVGVGQNLKKKKRGPKGEQLHKTKGVMLSLPTMVIIIRAQFLHIFSIGAK